MAFEVVGMSAENQAAWQTALGVSRNVDVNITSADILALDSVVKELVAAPGAGKVCRIDSIVVKYSFGTIEYTGGGHIYFQYGASGVTYLRISSSGSPLLGSNDQFLIAGPFGAVFTVFENQSIVMKASAAFLDGDGTAKVSIAYTVIDLS
ncbi:hypothetical protein [Mesorhizobium sp. ES1-4]|uniref:hypothetical protein n=1 Tax=Mesorhizobium sp. ES1-4 TaxID=2876627 RepID=UPI001CCF53AC|nr:hypothetical protein [Mesorhizobium sp. ES1-4]MBZ9794323.1 hypothetical protein [Mesorhizobium sp. ES1-4]